MAVSNEVHSHGNSTIFCPIVPRYLEQHFPAQHERTKKIMAEHKALAAGVVQPLTIYKEAKSIRIFTAQHKSKLPGQLVSSNIKPSIADPAAVKIYDKAQIVYDFLKKVFKLESVDGKNMALQFVEHYKNKYGNAFWNGRYLVIGDGDDVLKNFVDSLTVIAHEMGHAVQEKAGCNWNYDGKSGPLNEHMADFFGALCEQFEKKHTAAQATWDIGDEVIEGLPRLRTFKEELAYEDVYKLGSDPQPWKMSMLVATLDLKDPDNNVHKHSKIGNNAFRKFATYLGGYAYEDAADIWFQSMKLSKSDASYYDFYKTGHDYILGKYGAGSKQETAYNNAWTEVEILGYPVVRYWA